VRAVRAHFFFLFLTNEDHQRPPHRQQGGARISSASAAAKFFRYRDFKAVKPSCVFFFCFRLCIHPFRNVLRSALLGVRAHLRPLFSSSVDFRIFGCYFEPFVCVKIDRDLARMIYLYLLVSFLPIFFCIRKPKRNPLTVLVCRPAVLFGARRCGLSFRRMRRFH